MPKFTLDNSFRFYSQNGRKANIHSETIERLLQKLSSDWLRLLFARQEQIQAELMVWKKILFNINDALDDAMKMQATNQSVNMWLAKLPHLAYDVEDLLDEFQTEAFQRPGKETSQARTTSRLCDSMVMSKVKEINDRFQDIASQMILLGLKSTNISRRLFPTSKWVVLSSFHSRRRLIPTSKLEVAIFEIPLEDRKPRLEALNTVIRVPEVVSAEWTGDDYMLMKVTGYGIDRVVLKNLLRKKVGLAELMTH